MPLHHRLRNSELFEALRSPKYFGLEVCTDALEQLQQPESMRRPLAHSGHSSLRGLRAPLSLG